MKSLLNLVGISHCPGSRHIVPILQDGQPLGLIPEPSNPYDKNAIQVWVRLGYIKKEQAAKLKLPENELYPAKLITSHGNYAEIEIEEPSTAVSEPDNGEDHLGERNDG